MTRRTAARELERRRARISVAYVPGTPRPWRVFYRDSTSNGESFHLRWQDALARVRECMPDLTNAQPDAIPHTPSPAPRRRGKARRG